MMAFARTDLLGRFVVVNDLREELLPPRGARQTLIDIARRLFSICHRIRDVGSAGNHVATGIEALAARRQRETIDNNRSAFLDFKSRGTSKIHVEGFTDCEDHAVAGDALDLVGKNRLTTPGGVVFAQLRFDDFNGFYLAVGVADDAVRSGEEHE